MASNFSWSNISSDRLPSGLDRATSGNYSGGSTWGNALTNLGTQLLNYRDTQFKNAVEARKLQLERAQQGVMNSYYQGMLENQRDQLAQNADEAQKERDWKAKEAILDRQNKLDYADRIKSGGGGGSSNGKGKGANGSNPLEEERKRLQELGGL